MLYAAHIFPILDEATITSYRGLPASWGELMIRLTIFLSGSIWVAMVLAPELDEPVFAETAAKFAPVVEPEVTRAALVSPVKVAAVVTVAEPEIEPAPIEVVAIPEIEPEPEHVIWYVTGSKVNVREGPSTQYSVMGNVVYGEAAQVVSDLDADWIKIRIEGDGVEGYIMKRFMTKVDPLG